MSRCAAIHDPGRSAAGAKLGPGSLVTLRWLVAWGWAAAASLSFSPAATEFGGVIDRALPIVRGAFFDDLMARGDLRWIRLAGDWLTERGIDQVAVIRFAPPATRRAEAFPASRPAARVGRQSTTPLPDDLMALYWHCRTNLPVQRGVRQAWEIWNEPDFHFVADNPDRMAAVTKAAWWGVKAGNPAAQVLMPSLAFPPGPYFEELVRNGLGPYTDGYNLHHYGWAHEFLPHLRAHQAALDRAGWRLPLWITEAGHVEMVAHGTPSAGELARQQAYHERVAISAYAAGVDYYLPFILTPYIEGNSDLGLANADFSPRPALDSYLYLTRALPRTQPLFWLWHRPTASEVGVVLAETPATWWVVLWTPYRYQDLRLPPTGEQSSHSEVAPGRDGGGPDLRGATRLLRAARRPGGFRAAGPGEGGTELAFAFDFGRSGTDLREGLAGETPLGGLKEAQFQVAAEANLHLRVPAARFEIEDCEWRRITPASRWPWPSAGGSGLERGGARLEARPSRGEASDAPSPVVLQVDYAGASCLPHKPSRTYRYAPGRLLEARVSLYNFSEAGRSGKLSMTLPPRWKGQLSPSGEDGGSWHVPSLGRVTAQLTLEPPAPAVGKRRSGVERGFLPARVPFELRWRGRDGAEDIHAVWLEPQVVESVAGVGWPAAGWQNRPGFPDRWQVDPVGADRVRLTLQRPPPRGTSLSALYAFPEGWRFRAEDTLSLSMQTHSTATNLLYRVFLFTDDRQVLRYQDHEWLEGGETVWQARVGDLTRSLWSRIPSSSPPDPARIRFLSLEVTALQPGDWVEVRGGWGRGKQAAGR